MANRDETLSQRGNGRVSMHRRQGLLTKRELTTGAVDAGKVQPVDNVHTTGTMSSLVDLVVHALFFGSLFGSLLLGSLPSKGVGKLTGHGGGGLGRYRRRWWQFLVLKWTFDGYHGGRLAD